MEAHIAIFSSPGMGHVIPLIELAHQLLIHRHFSITFIIPTTTDSPIKLQNDVVNFLPENITSIFLPPVDMDYLPEDTALETRIILTMTRSLPALRETLAELTRQKRPSALVVDIFGHPSFEIAKEFGIPAYLFSTISAMSLVSGFYAPILDEMFDCEYRDLPEPVRLPGCIPVQGRDFPDPLQDKKNEAYEKTLQMTKRFGLAEGLLVNSFFDLQPGAFKALEEGEWCKPDIYHVGPLIRTGLEKKTHEGSECLKWLDKHPVGSVLFVSFGSGGTLSQEQLHELAFGLEQSGQRFLWVVKSPHGKSNASYFNAQTHLDPFEFLPNGFLDRVKDRGLVVPSWAPQVEILSHGSTGGFLTHCGWNSILESIVNGVPMIAWPLFAEQRLNAVLVTEDLRVAHRVNMDENGVIGRDEIDECVKSLMEGEDGQVMKKKIKELKDLGVKALSQDGSSTRSLSNLAHKWV